TRDGIGRDDSEMVADFRVVEYPLVRLDPIVVEHFTRERIFEFTQRRLYRRNVIFRQRARIGAWISDRLMPLVQRLCNLQSTLGRETEAIVRFALQTRKVIQLRRNLGAWLFFLQFDNTFSARALLLNGFGNFAMPQSRRSAMLVPKRSGRGIKPFFGISQIQL